MRGACAAAAARAEAIGAIAGRCLAGGGHRTGRGGCGGRSGAGSATRRARRALGCDLLCEKGVGDDVRVRFEDDGDDGDGEDATEERVDRGVDDGDGGEGEGGDVEEGVGGLEDRMRGSGRGLQRGDGIGGGGDGGDGACGIGRAERGVARGLGQTQLVGAREQAVLRDVAHAEVEEGEEQDEEGQVVKALEARALELVQQLELAQRAGARAVVRLERRAPCGRHVVPGRVRRRPRHALRVRRRRRRRRRPRALGRVAARVAVPARRHRGGAARRARWAVVGGAALAHPLRLPFLIFDQHLSSISPSALSCCRIFRMCARAPPPGRARGRAWRAARGASWRRAPLMRPPPIVRRV